MNTVVVMLVVILTVSWWLMRIAVKNRTPNPVKNFYAVVDPQGADLRRDGGAVKPVLLALSQQSRNDDRLPATRFEDGARASGKDPQPGTGEIHSPIRKRFLELKGEAAAAVERYREQQTRLNHQLARELASIREQLERLQNDANETLETIDPKFTLGVIRQARRDKQQPTG